MQTENNNVLTKAGRGPSFRHSDAFSEDGGHTSASLGSGSFLSKMKEIHKFKYDGAYIWSILYHVYKDWYHGLANNPFRASPTWYMLVHLVTAMWLVCSIIHALTDSIAQGDSLCYGLTRLFTTGMAPAFVQLVLITYPPMYKNFERQRMHRIVAAKGVGREE